MKNILKYKFSIKKVFRFIHLWLGLASGIVIFIVALTGAVLVFQEEIMAFNKEEATFSQNIDYSGVKPRPISEVLKVASNTINKFAPNKINPQFNSLWLGAEGENKKPYYNIDYTFLDKNNTKTVTIELDAVTAKIKKVSGLIKGNVSETTFEQDFWDTMLGLHMHLLIDYEGIGRDIVRYATLIFLIMTITGIVLWWPKNKKVAKQRFWFRWKDTVRWRRMNYDLHNILGFYACWIVFFAIITGLIWTFETIDKSVYFTASGGEVKNVSEKIVVSNASKFIDYKIFDTYCETAKKNNPTFLASKENYPIFVINVNLDKDNAPVDVEFRQRIETKKWYLNVAKENSYFALADRISGKILHSENTSIKNGGDFIDKNSGAIHYGTVFGLPSKILMFFGCLIAASLPISGFYIWWGKKKKKQSTG